MPIFEYICDNCGHKFEAFKKTDEACRVDCTKCNTSARRIYSSVPFIFGGTRWVGENKKEKVNSSEESNRNSKTREVIKDK